MKLEPTAQMALERGLKKRKSIRGLLLIGLAGLVMEGCALKNNRVGLISGLMIGVGLTGACISRLRQNVAKREYCAIRRVPLIGHSELGETYWEVSSFRNFRVFGGREVK